MHNRFFRIRFLMKVFDTLTELFDVESCSVKRNGLEALVPHELVEGDSLDVFLNKIYLLWGFKMIIQLTDVWMFEFLHAGNFTMDCSYLAWVIVEL